MRIVYLAVLMSLFNTKIIYGQDAEKIRIDPSQAYGGTVSDYFTGVEYIPLETTNESLFGDIHQLIVTDSSYVIKDLDTRSILFFSHDGKFIGKVKSPSLIYYDKIKNQIAFLKFTKNLSQIIIDFYSLLGKKIASEVNDFEKDGESGLNKTFFIPIEKDYYMKCNSFGINKSKNELPKPFFFLSIYKGDSLKKQFLPLDERKSTAISRIWGSVTPPAVISEKSFYISTPLDFNIYKLTKDTAIKLYQFVFPRNRMLSTSILESQDINLLDSIKNSIMQSQTFILDIENIYFAGSKIFFKIKTPSYAIAYNTSLNKYQYNFAYDTISHKLITIDRITPDVTSHFLPIMGERSKNNGLIPYRQYLYGYMSSLVLFNAKEVANYKKPQYSPVLQKYFETQDRKSNPVIVRMKLKE